MGEHKAVVQLVGLRHAKKGSTIAEALETIGPLQARRAVHLLSQHRRIRLIYRVTRENQGNYALRGSHNKQGPFGESGARILGE
jgi:hypothetical protein